MLFGQRPAPGIMAGDWFVWFHMVFHTTWLEQQMKVLTCIFKSYVLDYVPRTPEHKLVHSCLGFSIFRDVSPKTIQNQWLA